MKGMIFAAGIGSRLKPFTLYHPKALVKIGGKPIIQHVIERMKLIGISDITVNVHHFANQITDFIARNGCFGIDITISDESDQLLDTGGGIFNARKGLDGEESILIHNADILTDMDLQALADSHIRNNNDVTLAVAQRESSRQLYFNGDCLKLVGWQNVKTGETKPADFVPDGNAVRLAFSGIHVASPSIFTFLEEYAVDRPVFSIIPFYMEYIKKLKIYGYVQNDSFNWFDIGRPETLENARKWLNDRADYRSFSKK